MFVLLTFCLTVKLLQMPAVNFFQTGRGDNERKRERGRGGVGFWLKVDRKATRRPKKQQQQNILRLFYSRLKEKTLCFKHANSQVSVCVCVCVRVCVLLCVCVWPFCKSACNYPNRVPCSLQVY